MIREQPLSFIDVVRRLGHVAPSTILRILKAHPSRADFEIAYLRLICGGDRLKGEFGPLEEKAAQVYDILETDPLFRPARG